MAPFARPVLLLVLLTGAIERSAAAAPAHASRVQASTGAPRASQDGEAARMIETAAAHAAAGRYQRAREGYQRVTKRWPDSPEAREAARRLATNGLFSWTEVLRNGPSDSRIDVVFLGDGYTFEQQNAFDDIAADLPRVFERSAVFGEYLSYFNFLRGNVVSEEAGVDGYGREASTALGGRTLDYTNDAHVTVDPARVHAMLREIPGSEGLAVAVVKRGSSGTGGAGIATIGSHSFHLLLHEWGHAFAALGDEYATDRGFRHEIVSRAVNVSPSEDEERVPWAHWIEAGTPGVGTYEGAAGQVRGVWRPTASGCVMNDDELEFCEPCREEIVLQIYERVDPIESFRVVDLPEHDPLRVSESFEVEVGVLRPEKHVLQIRWWVLPASQAPRLREESRPRSRRGPLDPVAIKPDHHSKHSKDGRSRFRVSVRGREPGRYLVLVRVQDTAQPRGERRPWVLQDENELLWSERGLWIEIE